MSELIDYMHKAVSRFAYSFRSAFARGRKNDRTYEVFADINTAQGQHGYVDGLVYSHLQLPDQGAELTMITCPNKRLSFSNTPITVAQYTSFIERHDRLHHQHPIHSVTWFDALNFCNELSAYFGLKAYYIFNDSGVLEHIDQSSKGYRLPTEDEWVYIASSAQHLELQEDPTPLDMFAWFNENSSNKLQSVAQKKPTSWGAYDMYGLIWEWCENDYFLPSNNILESHSRAMRGGCYSSLAHSCSLHSRQYDTPTSRSPFTGFRVVKSC